MCQSLHRWSKRIVLHHTLSLMVVKYVEHSTIYLRVYNGKPYDRVDGNVSKEFKTQVRFCFGCSFQVDRCKDHFLYYGGENIFLLCIAKFVEIVVHYSSLRLLFPLSFTPFNFQQSLQKVRNSFSGTLKVILSVHALCCDFNVT